MSPDTIIIAAVLALCLVRVLLLLRPPPGTKLPDPSKVRGMPVAGPALPAAAHAALNRRPLRRWWQFWK